jgi:hypothetical protein
VTDLDSLYRDALLGCSVHTRRSFHLCFQLAVRSFGGFKPNSSLTDTGFP